MASLTKVENIQKAHFYRLALIFIVFSQNIAEFDMIYSNFSSYFHHIALYMLEISLSLRMNKWFVSAIIK